MLSVISLCLNRILLLLLCLFLLFTINYTLRPCRYFCSCCGWMLLIIESCFLVCWMLMIIHLSSIFRTSRHTVIIIIGLSWRIPVGVRVSRTAVLLSAPLIRFIHHITSVGM